MLRPVMFFTALALSTSAAAHGGGLNAQGCHNNRKNGGYHFHGSQTDSRVPLSSPPTLRQGLVARDTSDTVYPNCSAVGP